MKRNITISPVSSQKAFSYSTMKRVLERVGVAFLVRCRSIWDRNDLGVDHPEPLGYIPIFRSGWHQPQGCLAPH